MNKNGNEPAYPVKLANEHFQYPDTQLQGLTKREIFAGLALQGIMANPERWKQIAADYIAGKKTYEQCSQANTDKAVSLADALLVSLENTA